MAIAVGFANKPEGRAALDTAISEAVLRQLGITVVVAEQQDYDTVDELLAPTGIDYTIHLTGELQALPDALMDRVHSENVEFIIIGLRRRSPVGKLILGSNAQRILLDAPCPVVAVKAEASE